MYRENTYFGWKDWTISVSNYFLRKDILWENISKLITWKTIRSEPILSTGGYNQKHQFFYSFLYRLSPFTITYLFVHNFWDLSIFKLRDPHQNKVFVTNRGLYAPCECTDNLGKDKYVCTIFTILITLYVNSQLNGFHDLTVFTIILFHNTPENFQEKIVSKIAP